MYRRDSNTNMRPKSRERLDKVQTSMRRINHIVKARNMNYKRAQITHYLGPQAIEKLDAIIHPHRKGANRPKKVPFKFKKRFRRLLLLARQFEKEDWFEHFVKPRSLPLQTNQRCILCDSVDHLPNDCPDLPKIPTTTSEIS